MTVLEKAVQSLAEAIEALESRLDSQLDEAAANDEAIEAARRQAVAARNQTESASKGVAAAIADLKLILAEDDRKKPEQARKGQRLMSQVEIKVHGREYRVTCEKGQEDRLQKSAAFLNKRVSAMSADLPEISETRLMLLAALTICDELFEARERALDLEDAGVALDAETLGGASRAIEAAARRVSEITAKLGS